jgi:putative membrane protein
METEADVIPPGTRSTTEMAAERTDLAVWRSVMAADRTLMAWIRTALSMISFGFTIYKLLDALKEKGVALPNPDSPRNVGLFLTALGTLSMVMGTIEYWQELRELRLLAPIRIWRPAFVLALIMSILGLFLTVSIITRLF